MSNIKAPTAPNKDTVKTEKKTTTNKAKTMKKVTNETTNYLTTTKAGQLSYDMVTSDIKTLNLMDKIFSNLSSLKSDNTFKKAVNETINNITIARLTLGENYRADYIGFLRGALKNVKQSRLLMNNATFKKATMKQKYSSVKCIGETIGDTLINFEKHLENKKEKATKKQAPLNSKKDVTVATAKEKKEFEKERQTNKENKIIVAQKQAQEKAIKLQVKNVKSLDTKQLKLDFALAFKELKLTPENLVALQNLVTAQKI